MSLEIEIKTRLSSPDAIRKTLVQQFGQGTLIKRKDQYFSRAQDRFDHIRLREENEDTIITFKDKKISQGIEENLEIQFKVDNKEAFKEFLEKLRFFPSYSKEKNVETFYDKEQNLTYELVHIPVLGYFIEIESVIEKQSQAKEAHEKVHQALLSLGLEEKDIETQPYKALLEKSEKDS